MNELIESKGNQVFNVPNTDEGKKFLNDVKKYLNRNKYSYKSRGRGSRKEYGNQYGIALPNAEWIALYLEGSNLDTIRSYYDEQNRVASLRKDLLSTCEALRDTTAESNRLRRKVEELNRELAIAKNKIESAKNNKDNKDVDKVGRIAKITIDFQTN